MQPLHSQGQSLLGQLQEPALDYHQLPEPGELTRARQLFKRMTATDWQPSGEDREVAESLGFVWQDWEGLVILKEAPEQRRGNGAYVFNPDGDSRLMLQAPHRYHDRHTGVIAIRLFTLTGARSLALNTVHRYRPASDHGHSDIAHRHNSLMMPLTLAFAEQQPGGVIHQLHGFAKSNLPPRHRQARVILSQGHDQPGHALMALQHCLQRTQTGIKRYPHEIRKLGATTNAMVRALQETGFKGFVHIELEADVRDALRQTPSLRETYGECLRASVAEE
ncbi:MAG: hypothetical protein R3296_02760 [Oleiphilaceae bacterium]|nr:hypothetical protein [Oleiphilaceae bacterium]